MGLSGPFLKIIVRSGVRKLRAHFASLGALPVNAPLPNPGNEPGRNQHARYSQTTFNARFVISRSTSR